jgi:hypothetical protein
LLFDLGGLDEEAVPALPLSRRRRFLGLIAPAFNLPLLALVIYQFYVELASGAPQDPYELLTTVVLICLSFGLLFVTVRWSPVYGSRYSMAGESITIRRPLRKVDIPYKSIARAEVYVIKRSEGVIPNDAIQSARNAVDELRKSGFKFSDYTNAEDVIVLLIANDRVYMLSPENSKSFIKRLRVRVPNLPVRLVELTPRGKRAKNL